MVAAVAEDVHAGDHVPVRECVFVGECEEEFEERVGTWGWVGRGRRREGEEGREWGKGQVPREPAPSVLGVGAGALPLPAPAPFTGRTLRFLFSADSGSTLSAPDVEADASSDSDLRSSAVPSEDTYSAAAALVEKDL